MIESRNGAEGLRVWGEQGADLVLTDIRMPGNDGLEVILQLRAYAPRLPVKLEDGAISWRGSRRSSASKAGGGGPPPKVRAQSSSRSGGIETEGQRHE